MKELTDKLRNHWTGKAFQVESSAQLAELRRQVEVLELGGYNVYDLYALCKLQERRMVRLGR